METIKSKIRTIPHFPKEGIMFRDITTLLNDKEGLKRVLDYFFIRYKGRKIDRIVAIEARGFILGGALAHKLNLPLVLARKPGKLPGETASVEYELEYGTDKLEMHKDSIMPGENILVVDDLLATGGTARAACQLVEQLGGKVMECAFMVDLPDLKGKDKLFMYDIFTLVEFEGH